jgi:class 3 adenylate cyclase
MGASDGATTGLKTPGDVIAGALGDEHRLECTVVGDAVNTAARMERLTADLGTPLLISADVVAAAPGLERELRPSALSRHVLRRRSQPIHPYRFAVTPAIALRRSQVNPAKRMTIH